MKKSILLTTLTVLISFCSYGQELVKDITPGTKKSDYLAIHRAEGTGTIFMVTNDSVHGYELWTSWGTAATTRLVKDINPGTASAFSTFNQVKMGSLGSSVVFAANNGTDGIELWKSTGSAVGTNMLKDINPGSGSSVPRSFITYKDEVYFTANGPEGYELWKTDGTTAGTILVKDIITPFGSEPKDLTIFKDELYFVIRERNNNNNNELWKTDGSNTGTVRVSDSALNIISIQNLTVAGDKLYFSGHTVNEGVELWATDGTKAGTGIVKEFNIANQGPRLMINFKGKLYFSIYNGNGYKAIYESDGTEAGTKVMINFPDGIYSSFFEVMNDKFYFVGRHNATKNDIWASDGTNDGTHKVTDLDAIQAFLPGNLFASNNRLFFGAQYRADGNNAYELYVTDGTQNGTRLTKNINTKPNASALIYHMTEVGNTLYFAAADSAHGEELWKLETTSYKSLNLSDCDSVVFHDSTYFNSGTYLNNILNYKGYDSAVTLNVTTATVPQVTYENGIFTSTPAFQYQWQKDGADILGETSQTFTPSSNGVYTVNTVESINKRSCHKESAPFALNNVGIKNLHQQYTVYPNPARSSITIATEKPLKAVSIFTVSGAQVLSANLAQVNVSKLNDGVYILQVEFKDGTHGNSQLVIAK